MESIFVVSSILLWVIVLFNLLMTFALVRRTNASGHVHDSQSYGSPLNESLVGQQAPNFKAETLSGEEITLDNYRDRKVAFVFLGPGCPPCIENLPHYQAVAPKASEAGVELVLVSNGDRKQTQIFSKRHSINLPILVAPQPENSFMQDYKAIGTPSFTFVDETGIVQFDGFANSEAGLWKTLVDSWV